jgi:parvulin-like peptidyl-prolyl isomerase
MNFVKRTLIITVAILLTGLPLGLLAQQMQSAHTPTMSAPAPVLPSRDATASDASAALARPPQTPIARVNNVVLTQTQLDEEMQRLFPYYAIHGGRVPAGAEVELRKQAMHDMVLHELVYQEARRRNLQVPLAAWQKRLREMRQRFATRQAYEAVATKQYGSVAAFEHRLRRVMLVEQLWNLEVTRKAAVTDQAARVYYQGHLSQFVRPESVWLQTITIKIPASATAEQKQQAKKIAEEILVKAKAAKNYEEFGMLAQQLSQDDWRVMMGDHRWVHRAAVTPDIEQPLFSLKAGEISGLVESSTGYVILRANDHKQKRQMSYTEMASGIRQRMEKEKREQRSSEFELSLNNKAKVEML